MSNEELFKLFRKGNEPSFIKFLDRLGEINGKKESTNTHRSKRQDNRQSNRRQKQIIQTVNENGGDGKKSESTEKIIKIQTEVPRGEV